MFTGIVQQIGRVASLEARGAGRVLLVDPRRWDHRPAVGDSVAVGGCCLTVTAPGPDTADGWLRFDVMRQTLEATTLGEAKVGDPVNLEPALTVASPLGGHLVQGHVDGVGVVVQRRDGPGERRLRVEPPPELLDFIVDRGSIAVDGVSLTVAALDDGGFEVALIPATIEATTLGRVETGARVNLETDLLARTVVHWLRRHRP